MESSLLQILWGEIFYCQIFKCQIPDLQVETEAVWKGFVIHKYSLALM